MGRGKGSVGLHLQKVQVFFSLNLKDKNGKAKKFEFLFPSNSLLHFNFY